MLNDVLLERKVDAQYVTLTVLLWESRKCQLTLANAGAIPPMICRNGEIIKPKVEGVPAGLLDDREYEEVVFDTKPGDVIVLYSDGIQDQLNTKEEEYGKSRLARVLKKSWGSGVEAIADEILKSLDDFTSGAPAFDDQTMLVLKVR
jgi:sigma-B regulation protein RsbU (phosphoserine phosphatase)